MARILVPTFPHDVHAVEVALVLREHGHEVVLWHGGDFPTRHPYSLGIFQNQIEGDENNLDPLSTGRGNGGWTSELAYSRPFVERAAAGGTKTADFLGDLAESYEVQDGGLRLLVKLRPEARWDARAPTNGRAVDTDDVSFSWDRYVKLSPFAAKLSYEVSKGAAPIESVQKIDARMSKVPSRLRSLALAFEPPQPVGVRGPFRAARPDHPFDADRCPVGRKRHVASAVCPVGAHRGPLHPGHPGEAAGHGRVSNGEGSRPSSDPSPILLFAISPVSAVRPVSARTRPVTVYSYAGPVRTTRSAFWGGCA